MTPTEHWPAPVRPWPPDFPLLLVHCSLPDLYAAAAGRGEALVAGRSATYLAAKAGDPAAAGDVVEAVIDVDAIARVGQAHPNAVVVAVHAEEASGRNKLPAAYAVAVADIGGLFVDDAIVQINRVFHTDANARQRLRSVPRFAGPVEPGREYVVVDDVCTTGSTLAALRHYVEARGGQVVLASCLAAPVPRHGQDPRQLPVTPATRSALRAKFDPAELDDILSHYGIAPSVHHLTESAGRTILGFDSAHALRSSLAAGR